MRNTLLSVFVLAGLSACASGSAYADGPCPDGQSARCTPIPAVQRRPPAAPSPRIEVVDEGSSPLPTFTQDSRTYVLGAVGSRYLVRVVNPTPARVEAVVSVDGIDAVDGRPASTAKRGYIVPAWGSVTIDGWRTSMSSVAAFRFSSVRDSYAGRTGHDRNVGVIGVAFFRERPRPVWRPQPNIAKAWPAPAPPSAARSSADMGSGAAGGSSAPSAQSAPRAEAAERPGLGTEFGEAHSSSVEEVTFQRAESTPMTVAQLWYDDRDGLVARGIPVAPRDTREAEIELRETAQPFAERFAQPPP
jgi:hypothetical protein